MIHLEMGTYENWYYSVPTIYQEEGYNLYMARALKEAGIKTPLISGGKLHRPDFARKVIEEGVLDIVGLGHQCFADPEWPNKVQDGREGRDHPLHWLQRVHQGRHNEEKHPLRGQSLRGRGAALRAQPRAEGYGRAGGRRRPRRYRGGAHRQAARL